jgi:hypothetical protein
MGTHRVLVCAPRSSPVEQTPTEKSFCFFFQKEVIVFFVLF